MEPGITFAKYENFRHRQVARELCTSKREAKEASSGTSASRSPHIERIFAGAETWQQTQKSDGSTKETRGGCFLAQGKPLIAPKPWTPFRDEPNKHVAFHRPAEAPQSDEYRWSVVLLFCHSSSPRSFKDI